MVTSITKVLRKCSIYLDLRLTNLWSVCLVAGAAVPWILLEMLFFFQFVFVAVTDIGKYESNCWFVGSLEKVGILPLQTYVFLN